MTEEVFGGEEWDEIVVLVDLALESAGSLSSRYEGFNEQIGKTNQLIRISDGVMEVRGKKVDTRSPKTGATVAGGTALKVNASGSLYTTCDTSLESLVQKTPSLRGSL